jgi:hypothetical protein
MDEDPVEGLHTLLGHLFVIGSKLACLQDSLERCPEWLRKPPTPDELVRLRDETARLQGERDGLSNELAEARRKLSRSQDDLRLVEVKFGNAEKQIDRLKGELASSDRGYRDAELKVARLEKEKEALTAELVAEKVRSSDERAEWEAEFLRDFFRSEGFQTAAMVSVMNMVRGFLYTQLEGLAQLYPFTPEGLGFDKKFCGSVPSKLEGYKWDRATDQLLDPSNVPVPQKMELRTGRELPIAFPWKDVHPWPLPSSPSASSPVLSLEVVAEAEMEENVPETPSAERDGAGGGRTGADAS